MVLLAALPSLGAGGENPEGPLESWTQLWFFRFLVNAAGYASFMVPGYLLVQYFRRKNYLETGVWGSLLSLHYEGWPAVQRGGGVAREEGRPAGRAGSCGGDEVLGRSLEFHLVCFLQAGVSASPW